MSTLHLNPIHTNKSRRSSSPVRYILMLLRRSHLYLGLLLAPWAMLYGVTGYLFNHPSHFADTPMRVFGSNILVGTDLEAPPAPHDIAIQVVAELNTRFPNNITLQLDPDFPSRYVGDFLFANVDLGDTNYQLLLHRSGSGGTLRQQKKPQPSPQPKAKARFNISPASTVDSTKQASPATGGIGPRDDQEVNADPLFLDDAFPVKARNSLPAIFERLGVPCKSEDIRLTSTPELEFQVLDGDSVWNVRYNAVAGSVICNLPADAAKPELSWRRFLLRMHTAHGYPGEYNAKWFWAIIVDVMSFVLIFWAISGLAMWWQIKRTRRWGTVALLFSLAFAGLLGWGMLAFLQA